MGSSMKQTVPAVHLEIAKQKGRARVSEGDGLQQSPLGDDQYKALDLITMELNADVGTLHFFVDGIQQPVFMKGINEPVKFQFWIWIKDSSFSVLSINQLNVSTANAIPNEISVQW
ncbi:MAG: hypothetical protein EZS28_027072 [Streblomastix strix]|uniref:SPRY domain-containing protein n=1 Tax=Streblomastix strix TaxID=222440 RepID=A0A5J4V510_9EUKA|nr:MAG: hypothetical protein EZS28_027072 [Streblomastix strix]